MTTPAPALEKGEDGFKVLRELLEALRPLLPRELCVAMGARLPKDHKDVWHKVLTSELSKAARDALTAFVMEADERIVGDTVKRHWRNRSHVAWVDPDDAHQDALQALMRKIPELLAARDPIGLIYVIAKQAVVENCRRGRKRVKLGPDDAASQSSPPKVIFSSRGTKIARPGADFPKQRSGYIEREFLLDDVRAPSLQGDQSIVDLELDMMRACLDLARESDPENASWLAGVYARIAWDLAAGLTDEKIAADLVDAGYFDHVCSKTVSKYRRHLNADGRMRDFLYGEEGCTYA